MSNISYFSPDVNDESCSGEPTGWEPSPDWDDPPEDDLGGGWQPSEITEAKDEVALDTSSEGWGRGTPIDLFDRMVGREGSISIPLSRVPAGETFRCPVEGHTGEAEIIRQGRQFRCECEGTRTDYARNPPPMLDVLPASQTLDLQPGEYLPLTDPAPDNDLAIKAPKGVGKTTWVRWWISMLRAANPDQRFIAISSRVSLVDQMAARLDLPHYREDYADDNGLLPIDGSVASCINSIRRIPLQDLDDAIVIIDESESTVQALAGGTMNDLERQAVQRHLRAMVGQAKRLILLDADLSPYSCDFFNAIRDPIPTLGGDPKLHILTVNQRLPWKYQTTGDRTAWEAEVFEAVGRGEKIVVAMTVRTGTQALADRLKARFPGLRIAVISQDTVDEKVGDTKKYDLKDIDAWVTDFDVLIYSPTIASGVSIDIEGYFNRIFGYFTPKTLTAQEFDQMLHRVREPVSDEILVYLGGGQTFLTTDPEKIRQQLLAREAETMAGAHALGLDGPINPDARFRWDAEQQTMVADAEGLAYLDHFCTTVAYRRKNGVQGVRAGFYAYLDTLHLEHPWLADALPPLPDEERAALNRERREATEVVKAAARKELLEATDIDISEADEINERGPVNKAEKLAAQKAYIRDFYGDVDEEILIHDEEGGRAKSRALAALLHYQEDREANEKHLRKLDLSEHRWGVSAAGLGHVFERTRVLDVVLSWYGVDGTDAVLDRDTAVAAVKIARKRRRWLKKWGFTVRRDINEQPLRLLSDVLRSVGLRLTRKRRRVDGERVYETRMDLSVLAKARQFAAAELARIGAGGERGVPQLPSIEEERELWDGRPGTEASETVGNDGSRTSA